MEKTADTAHPVHELIARRWSPRALAPQPVPAGQLRSLLEAARWAASSFNEQPWSFLVARREDSTEFERMLACLVPGNRTWAAHAGTLMLTVASCTFAHNGKPNRVALHDIGLAAANLTFQATALGLWVHQMAGIDRDRIRETYAIPEGYDPVTAIAIGASGDPRNLPEDLQAAERAPRERKAQHEFVFEGSWGRSAGW